MIHLGSFVLQFPIPSIKVEPPETNDNSNKSRSMATVTVPRTNQSGNEVAGAGSTSSTSRHPGYSANKASTSTSAGKSSTGNLHSRSYSPTNSVVSSVESISRRVEEKNSSKGIPPRRAIPIPALPLIKGARRISRFNSNESIGSSGPSHSFTVVPKLPGSNGNANTGQVVEPQNARRDSRGESGGGGHISRQQPQKNKADVDDRGEKRRRLSEPGPGTKTGTTTNTNHHRPAEGRQPETKGPAAVTPDPAQPHARTNSGTHVASHRDREREKHANQNRSQERNDRHRGDRNRNQENRHQHNNHNHAHNRHSSSRPPTLNKNHYQGHSRDGRKDGSYSPRKDYDNANRHDNSSRRPGPGSQSHNVQYYCRVVTEVKQEQIQIKEEVIDLRQQFAIRNEEYDDGIYAINRRQDEQGTHIIQLHHENDQTKARLAQMEHQIRQGQQQRHQPAHNAGPATEGFKCPDCHHVFQSKSYMLRKHKGTPACIKNRITDGTRAGPAGNRAPAYGKAAAARAKPTPEATYGRFAERGSSSLGRPHWNRQEGEKSPPFNVTSRLRPPRLQKNTTRRR